MFVVTVFEPGGDCYSLVFEKHEITIGRTPDNDVVLADDNVSQYHARISLRGGKFILVDNRSTNGIYLNSVEVSAPVIVVSGSDEIHIATYALHLSVVRQP